MKKLARSEVLGEVWTPIEPSKSLQFCTRCGAEPVEEALFCSSCGASISEM